jgi:starch-binding outer membrane protein, SusD/RagB family
MNKRQVSRVIGAALAGALILTGCDLSVSNPGHLADADLNTPAAMNGLVVGMSADLSIAVGNLVEATSLMSDEMTHSGNYANEGWWYAGDFGPEHVNTVWGNMQRARWEAETGIQRMQDVLGSDFDTNALAPRAYLFAGYANRLLGENVCQAVIDGGAPESNTVHFQRAEDDFSNALTLAQAQGETDMVNAAYAGRASVRADQGDWTGAVADASQVPADFEFDALFSTNTSREENDFAYETITRREYSVALTSWANDFNDPRVPWDSVFSAGGDVQTGNDGQTPFFRQTKYTSLGANVPMSKGTEMLMIRAEAALRNNDLATFTDRINDARDVYGMVHITQPATVADAWTVMQFERGATNWLEARRFWDLRRWGQEGLNTFLQNRANCIPISQEEEMSNPNVP